MTDIAIGDEHSSNDDSPQWLRKQTSRNKDTKDLTPLDGRNV